MVFRARGFAQERGRTAVTPSDLLHGVLSEPDSVASALLLLVGVNRQSLLKEIGADRLQKASKRPSDSDMYLTLNAKRVIDLAYDEARNLENNYIGSEHLLLGIVRLQDEHLRGHLTAHGLTLQEARKMLREVQEKNVEPERQQSNQPAVLRDDQELLPRGATMRFHPDIPPALVYEFLEKLADFYRACGGAGFAVDADEEEIRWRVPAHV